MPALPEAARPSSHAPVSQEEGRWPGGGLAGLTTRGGACARGAARKAKARVGGRSQGRLLASERELLEEG